MDDSQIIDLYFERSEAAIAETDRKYHAYLNLYPVLREIYPLADWITRMRIKCVLYL